MQQMRVRPFRTQAWTLNQVAQELPVPVSINGVATVSGISLNTADVQHGDLYAALPGSKTHGAVHAQRALSLGARAILTDPSGAALLPVGTPHLVVTEPRGHLASLSARFYDYPSRSFATIGVTGTQGKTTTTYLAESALGRDRTALVGTIGTRIAGVRAKSSLTTPEAPALQALFAVMREEGIEACAMEVSSHALVLGRVDGFVFDNAVFLNLGRDHLDFHSSVEDYFEAKASLFTPQRANAGVINIDDEFGRRLFADIQIPSVTFSTQGRQADWLGTHVRAEKAGSHLRLRTPSGDVLEVYVPLPGAFNVSNAIAAIAALAERGHDPAELVAGVAASPGVPGRMEHVFVGQSFTAVIDYAHKPDAVAAILQALRPLTDGKLIIVLGAGGDRDQGKRPIMGKIAAELADVVIVTDDNPRTEDPAAIRSEILEGTLNAAASVTEISGRREAIAHAVLLAQPGDTIVVAGKGHEQGQEINGTVFPFDDRDELIARIEAIV